MFIVNISKKQLLVLLLCLLLLCSNLLFSIFNVPLFYFLCVYSGFVFHLTFLFRIRSIIFSLYSSLTWALNAIHLHLSAALTASHQLLCAVFSLPFNSQHFHIFWFLILFFTEIILFRCVLFSFYFQIFTKEDWFSFSLVLLLFHVIRINSLWTIFGICDLICCQSS